MDVDDQTTDEGDDAPVAVSLSLPSYSAEENILSVEVTEHHGPGPGGVSRRSWLGFQRCMFDKKRSDYSSIAPRRADGTRSKTFFFNGNG